VTFFKPRSSTFVVLFAVALGAAATNKSLSPLSSARRKIAHLEQNAKLRHPDPVPTILTEAEINAYLASDEIAMPKGVQSVRLVGESGTITGNAHVDFDQVRAGIHSSNPLLSVFSGVHDVEVVTHSYGKGGQGFVHVDSVSLDGIEIPNMVLELFVEKYLTPRYPQIGMDSRFTLPDRIDSAVVGQHQVVLTQK
jgi:hypothetical protein